LHPQWKFYTDNYDADIALIILESKVQIANSIFPICLWDKKTEQPTENRGIVVGWGKSSGVDSKPENKPRQLAVEIRTNEECFLTNPRLATISSKNTFCAGKDETSGPCHGKIIS
jgi:Trypsin